MYGDWSVKHAYTQIFLAHCVKNLEVSSERAKCFLRIVRHTNAKQRYH